MATKKEENGIKYAQLQEGHYCLECGNELLYGRRDRKFCNEKCRYDYHNSLSRVGKASRARTMSALDRNYSILSRLLKHGIKEISMIQITEMGFNPAKMTSAVMLRSHLECAVYDIHYRQSDSKISCITKVSVYLSAVPRKK